MKLSTMFQFSAYLWIVKQKNANRYNLYQPTNQIKECCKAFINSWIQAKTMLNNFMPSKISTQCGTWLPGAKISRLKALPRPYFVVTVRQGKLRITNMKMRKIFYSFLDWSSEYVNLVSCNPQIMHLIIICMKVTHVYQLTLVDY